MTRELIFIGGGHTNALAINQWAKHPIKHVRATLISPQTDSSYSGMLPGLLAGHYTFEQAHINLPHLCQRSKVQFIQQAVTAIDHQRQTIQLADHRELRYDIASINVGATPSQTIAGSQTFATPVKPISEFFSHWQKLMKEEQINANQQIAVIGGGAGSVELILAMAQALQHTSLKLTLITRGPDILSDYPIKVREYVKKIFDHYQIELHTNLTITSIDQYHLYGNGQTYAFDHVFVCTQASAAPWLEQSGLATSSDGFIRVNDYLQTHSASNIFAAGDCIHFQSHPLPKAGVYAVREATILWHNIRACLKHRCSQETSLKQNSSEQTSLKPYRPQKDFLSLLSLGDQNAIGTKYGISIQGHWVWRWKDYIDRQFMRQFVNNE